MKLTTLAIVLSTVWLALAAQPASAFCVLGDPVALDGCWSQTFVQGKLGELDHVRVDWIAGSQFESPVFSNFSDGGWSVLWERATGAVSYTSKPGTGVAFDLLFKETPSAPVDFYLTAFAGNELVESARATWSGEKCVWLIVPDNFKPDAEDPGAAPEPLTVVLISAGLAASSLAAKRKKAPPDSKQ
ncbi:MAG: hypothetical protein ACE15D_17985 [Candidatus Eisenbacteria bacterium]